MNTEDISVGLENITSSLEIAVDIPVVRATTNRNEDIINRVQISRVWQEILSQIDGIFPDLEDKVKSNTIALRGFTRELTSRELGITQASFIGAEPQRNDKSIANLGAMLMTYGADRPTSPYDISPSGEPFMVATSVIDPRDALHYAFPLKKREIGFLALYDNSDLAIQRVRIGRGLELEVIEDAEAEKMDSYTKDQMPTVIVNSEGGIDLEGWRQRLLGIVMITNDNLYKKDKFLGLF